MAGASIPGLVRLVAAVAGHAVEWSAGTTCGKPLGLAALAVWQRAQSTVVSGRTGFTDEGSSAWLNRKIGLKPQTREAEQALIKILGRRGGGRKPLEDRAVAGLAVHVRMLAGIFLLRHIRMAGLARLVAGELHRPRRNLADGRPAIVPILAKALGHNKVAHHQKDQKGEHKEPRKPEKMPCILENAHQTFSTTTLRELLQIDAGVIQITFRIVVGI